MYGFVDFRPAVDGRALPPVVVDWDEDKTGGGGGLRTLMPLVCAHFDDARCIAFCSAD